MAAGSRHLSGGEGGALNMINPANTRHRWQKLTSLSSSKWRRPLSPLNKNLMSAVCWPVMMSSEGCLKCVMVVTNIEGAGLLR